MKIGLIGAPGSGKSELAEQIAKEKGLKVIDGYAERWSERTGLAIGYSGGYVHSLGIALDRVFEEAKVEDDFVTVGTSVDTLMYMAMASLKSPNRIEFIRAKTYIETIAILFYDSWAYDHVFVCRLPETEAPDPNQTGTAEELLDNFELNGNIRYDSELQDTLKSFSNIERTELSADVDRLKLVMETIDAAEDKSDEDEES